MDPIDEPLAWELVRAVPPGVSVNGGLARIRSPSAEVWLELDASGRWEASSPVTDAARELLDLYLPLQLHEELAIAQLGQSLDGRIATESGHSRYVTGPEDIRRLHRLRSLVDAVIVGTGTVAMDDPRLTVREVEGENPVRVVLDPSGRLAAGARVFSDGAARTLVIRRTPLDGGSAAGTRDVLTMAVDAEGDFDPAAVLRELRRIGLKRVLVEGGGITVSRFLQAGVLDRLHVTVSPLLIGSGRPSLVLEPIETLEQGLRPPCRHFRLGADILFDLELR